MNVALTMMNGAVTHGSPEALAVSVSRSC